MAFATFAEAGPRGADDLGFIEEKVEKLPRVAAGINPNIRRIIATDAGHPELLHGFADEFGVAEIKISQGFGLGLSLGRIDGRGRFLHGIRHAIKFGGVAAIPKGVDGVFLASRVAGLEVFWNDGVSAAETREAG